jgi:hypothetical protein
VLDKPAKVNPSLNVAKIKKAIKQGLKEFMAAPPSPDKLSSGSALSPVFIPLKRVLHPPISTP